MLPRDSATNSNQGVELCFPPRKRFVGVATDFVTTFSAEHIDDEEALARIRLAAHELTENVVKYSNGAVCVVEARYIPGPAANGARATLTITTQNNVEPQALDEVHHYLERLERAGSPDRFYDEQIAESVKRANGSGLGLARIRSEALMEISHRVIDGKLRISAALALPRSLEEVKG